MDRFSDGPKFSEGYEAPPTTKDHASLTLEQNTRHISNSKMADMIASVLNKVITTYSSDKFATPLRIQRDLFFGPEVHPPDLDRSGQTGPAFPKLPPIDW